MREEFSDLPGWTFEIDEVSNNLFQVVGRDSYGNRVEAMGVNSEAKPLEDCKRAAAKLIEDQRRR
jgi:hypothetical protein